MGNRGILKPRDFDRVQPFASGNPWIACRIRDKNGHPIPPSPVKYTKLFLLDEVTAFAAGHRPCGGCQRERYGQFVDAWCEANRQPGKMLDEILMAERCSKELGGHKPVVVCALRELPGGTMVQLARGGQPHLWLGGKLFPWTVEGYGAAITVASLPEVYVLTPMSIVRAFQAGFPLPLNNGFAVHPSIAGAGFG